MREFGSTPPPHPPPKNPFMCDVLRSHQFWQEVFSAGDSKQRAKYVIFAVIHRGIIIIFLFIGLSCFLVGRSKV